VSSKSKKGDMKTNSLKAVSGVFLQKFTTAFSGRDEKNCTVICFSSAVLKKRPASFYGMGLIGGFCHLYIGQEAVVTGVQSVQKPQDTVITAYRNHGHMLVSGISADEVMAELTGREGGCSRGKGGSMHMFSVEK
jgi:pyruvate dehydrogenase E1 component alpha subunit